MQGCCRTDSKRDGMLCCWRIRGNGMIRLPCSQHQSPVPFTSKSIQERQHVLFLMMWHRNQEQLNIDLTSVLYHLRGPDAHQVGNAAFSFFMQFVMKTNVCRLQGEYQNIQVLQNSHIWHSIIVSPDDAIPFDKYVSDFQSQYVLPWCQYCNVAIHCELHSKLPITFLWLNSPQIIGILPWTSQRQTKCMLMCKAMSSF